MKINPLTWSKKQQIIGGAVAILLVGGIATEVVVNANHQAEVRKIEQAKKVKIENAKIRAEKAKQLERTNEADSKKLLDNAEKVSNDANIKLAEGSILKVKNAEAKKVFTDQLVGIKNRVKLENTAKTAVNNYQKDAMNQDKYKLAQQAVNKVTSPYSKALKESLTKQLSASKKQADEALKVKQAKSTSESKSETPASATASSDGQSGSNVAQSASASASGNVSIDSSSPSVQSQAPQNQSSSPAQPSNTPSQAQQPQAQAPQTQQVSQAQQPQAPQPQAPQTAPVYRFVGWVSVDGVRKYSQTFGTIAEAQGYVDSTVNSPEVVNLGFDHSIRYGMEPIQVN